MLRMNTDAIMCFLWILAYTLVLVGTEKYKYPLISPITQLAIAPFEFAVLIKLLVENAIGINYVSLSYLYWTVVEIAIVAVLIKHGFIPRKCIWSYLLLISVITIIMCYMVVYKGQQFFFSYFNTFIGELVWLMHIRKKEYPMKPMVFLMFCVKFIGDAISIPVYYGKGPWIINLICILVPMVDFMFIHIYLQRRTQESIK